MNQTVFAPGKLVIAGEYAVLDGAPAIVLAIDRGVRCDIEPANTLTITTPDGDDRFVRPALQDAPAAHYRFSAWNPTDLPEKPGFGGSAAACVAACIAAGRPAQERERGEDEEGAALTEVVLVEVDGAPDGEEGREGREESHHASFG